jgi:hypothetical protein
MSVLATLMWPPALLLKRPLWSYCWSVLDALLRPTFTIAVLLYCWILIHFVVRIDTEIPLPPISFIFRWEKHPILVRSIAGIASAYRRTVLGYYCPHAVTQGASAIQPSTAVV